MSVNHLEAGPLIRCSGAHDETASAGGPDSELVIKIAVEIFIGGISRFLPKNPAFKRGVEG